ncbi:MAG: YraN family protein [Paraclostridium sp.]|uniref:YraN family protein n=1 Tax=Paraclostridium sp. TaxID=2023273 RepID=UPI003F3E257C
MNNIEKGNLGEEIATKYLRSMGAYIIENNYKIKCGEVDIIASLNNEVIFVEVKARSNTNFGYPAEAVNYKKRLKIINVAKYYILKNKLDQMPIRFDVIEVYLKDNHINHIENAF